MKSAAARGRGWGAPSPMGAADNKIMTKLSSDYKKPNVTTVIAPEDYERIVWPLHVADLCT